MGLVKTKVAGGDAEAAAHEGERMTRNRATQQHWVPQMYMRNWCTEKGLYVADKLTGRILPNQNPRNFAQERSFYAYVDLSPDELKRLVVWTYESFPVGIALIDEMLTVMVLNVLRFRMEKQDWNDDYGEAFASVKPKLRLSDRQENAYSTFFKRASSRILLSRADIENLTKITANGFEDYHCAIESGAKKVLDLANGSDLSFLKNDQNQAKYFYMYFYDQFFRSKKYLKMLENNNSEIRRKVGATNAVARNIRYFLPVYYYYLSMRVKDRRKMAVIKNVSPLEFVTSDAPIVLNGGLEDELPEYMYFPLSPSTAVIYGTKRIVNKTISHIGRTICDDKIVANLNQQIFEQSDRFVFASSQQSLEELLRRNGVNGAQETPPCVTV